nr:zinc-dependent peptidase [Gammaproteobacteria bacterium]
MISLRRWRHCYRLRRERISNSMWNELAAGAPLIAQYAGADRTKLRRLTERFMLKKDIRGVGGLEMTDPMRLLIAASSCVPILHLDLDWYLGWVSVLVYPAGFVVHHEFMDEAGVMHDLVQPLSGESWLRGPVILSWEDVAHDAIGASGRNLVIHELAHKLDALNGVVNGMPPLHRGMDRAAWTAAFADAFNDLQGRVLEGRLLPIDGYGAEAPGEFFAVASEALFVKPVALYHAYPEVYRQMCRFYRQDPADWVRSRPAG